MWFTPPTAAEDDPRITVDNFVTWYNMTYVGIEGSRAKPTPVTQRANLSFAVIPTVGASQTVTLEAQINGGFILQETFASADQRVWHENFDASILQTNNTLTLIKAGGLGELSLADFIIHFKTV